MSFIEIALTLDVERVGFKGKSVLYFLFMDMRELQCIQPKVCSL